MDIKSSYNFLIVGVSAVASFIVGELGGWDKGLKALIVFMVADYLAGIVLAGVFKGSTKTDDGGLSSKAGYKGIVRKAGMLLVVFIAVQLDNLLNLGQFTRNAIILLYCANESLSILEKLGLMGVWIPDPIKDAISALKKKGEQKHDNDTLAS